MHTFAESGYYEVRTTGTVTYEKNADAANTGCGMYCIGVDVDGGPDPGGTIGGAGRPEGDLRTYITVTTGETPYSGDYGIMAQATPDGQVTALVAAGSRRWLWAKRSGIAGVRSCGGTCGDMPDGPTGWFLLDSKEGIEARRVTPIQVAPDKPEFVQGEVVNWTTARHALVEERTYWFWTPEGGYRTQISCTDTTCSYAPPGSGTMLAISHYYESGYLVEVSASAAAKAVVPTLKLKCNDAEAAVAVTRGETVACEAFKHPAHAPGTVTVTEWSFDGRVRTDGSLTSTTWGGPMAQSGDVQVKGQVGESGALTAAAVAITVAARDWTGRPVPLDPALEITRDPDLARRPTLPKQLGTTDHGTRGVLTAGRTYQAITEGPNTGLAYLLDIPMTAWVKIYLAQGALSVGSAFYNHQTSGPAPAGICTQSDVPPFLPLVEEHEGVPDAAGNFPLRSHAGLFTRKLAEIAGPRTEGLVRPWSTATKLFEDIAPVLLGISDEALNASDALDLPANAIQYCTFQYFTP